MTCSADWPVPVRTGQYRYRTGQYRSVHDRAADNVRRTLAVMSYGDAHALMVIAWRRRALSLA